MAYFGVGENTGYFWTTKYELKLNFQLRTILWPFERGLKLVPIDEIHLPDDQFPYLVSTEISFMICIFKIIILSCFYTY